MTEYTDVRDALIRRVVAAGQEAVANHPDTASRLLEAARALHADQVSYGHVENILRLARMETA